MGVWCSHYPVGPAMIDGIGTVPVLQVTVLQETITSNQ